jgi:hypothetical protein
MLFNEMRDKKKNAPGTNVGSDLSETYQKQIEERLKSVKVGESISGKDLAKALGVPELTYLVSKITKIDNTTFAVTRTLAGKGALNNSPLSIAKTNISIGKMNVSVYKIQIDYKSTLINLGCLPEFYVHGNDILYYEKNVLVNGKK